MEAGQSQLVSQKMTTSDRLETLMQLNFKQKCVTQLEPIKGGGGYCPLWFHVESMAHNHTQSARMHAHTSFICLL